MKILRRLFAALMLVVATAGGGFAVTDQGDPAVSRLWLSGDPDRFACTVSYIFPYINDHISWVVTAGHCAEATLIKRNADVSVIGVANWRGVLLGDPRYTDGFRDLAVGTVPDVRDGKQKRLWLADEMPKSGEVYIHGFPAGVERVSLGYIIPDVSPDLPGATLVAVKAGEIVGGSSGSPVLDANGRVVGILWGVVVEPHVPNVQLPGRLAPGYDLALVTPVERLHELMKLLGVK